MNARRGLLQDVQYFRYACKGSVVLSDVRALWSNKVGHLPRYHAGVSVYGDTEEPSSAWL